MKKFNLKLFRFTTYQRIKVSNFLNTIKNKRKLDNTIKCLPYFCSQFGQDLFVLNELNFKKNGFFVEFGATNGINGSNTYLLENKFNWRGILAEPAKIFYDELNKNRKCFLETNLVWKNSQSRLLFHEDFAGGLSTIKKFIDHDTQIRKKNKEYILETISLNDLLVKYNAPKIID